jgi:late competence protein required for DNA uptake (superfamily II DNA/RNA helicase)
LAWNKAWLKWKQYFKSDKVSPINITRHENCRELMFKRMDLNKIAGQLADYCKKGQRKEAYVSLFAENIVSIESYSTLYFQKETIGLEAVWSKPTIFETPIEKLHKLVVSEPLIAGNYIALTVTVDAVRSNIGRLVSSEICVYTVGDGQVVKEECFLRIIDNSG